jgi:exopolysaccharide/PEP-CTERM locus tyrosine autokinase
MSTIERAAEQLGSVRQTPQKPSTAIERASVPEQGPPERAAGDFARRRGASGDKPGRSTGGATRMLQVDRGRLRRQSMITPDGERTAIAESFRRVKRQILANVTSAANGAPPANLVMVTSALAGEGKTFCAINLAISIALEVDRSVLLVDADVAKPSVPKALGLETDKGLMEVLLDRRLDLAEVLWKTDIGSLTLLPVGKAHKHATELLASDAMRGLLREMAARYHDRIVIFDSPPLLAASEAGVLASQMGQILVVVESGKTSEAALKDALGRVDSSKVAGLLLNKGESPGLGYGYGGYG